MAPADELVADTVEHPGPRPRKGVRKPPRQPPRGTRPPASDVGLRIANAAQHYLAAAPPSAFRRDCSGFVCAVLDRAGAPTAGNTASLWSRAEALGATHTRKRPEPGDLVFFDDTYDRNGNGRVDDPLTHIGVVVSVDDRDTVRVAHLGTSAGRSVLMLNLRRPHDHADDDGAVLNSHLRRRRSSDGGAVRTLAGELWRGFATIRAADLAAWAEGT